MSIVTITLGTKNLQLVCNDGSEGELRDLAFKLNETIGQIKKLNPSASFELLLVMSALDLQQQIQSLSDKIAQADSVVTPGEKECTETLAVIANYLENLAKKIGK